jgi:hypothetical protein
MPPLVTRIVTYRMPHFVTCTECHI